MKVDQADRLSLEVLAPPRRGERARRWVHVWCGGSDAPNPIAFIEHVAGRLLAVGIDPRLRWKLLGDETATASGSFTVSAAKLASVRLLSAWPVEAAFFVEVDGDDVLMADGDGDRVIAARVRPGGRTSTVTIADPVSFDRVTMHSGVADEELARWAVSVIAVSDTPRLNFAPSEVKIEGRWTGVVWRAADRLTPLVIWTRARGEGLERARDAIAIIGLAATVGPTVDGSTYPIEARRR